VTPRGNSAIRLWEAKGLSKRTFEASGTQANTLRPNLLDQESGPLSIFAGYHTLSQEGVLHIFRQTRSAAGHKINLLLDVFVFQQPVLVCLLRGGILIGSLCEGASLCCGVLCGLFLQGQPLQGLTPQKICKIRELK